MQKKRFVIENTLLFSMIVAVLGTGLILTFDINNVYRLSLFILLCIVCSIPFIIARKFKIGCDELEPNVLYITDIEMFFKNLTTYLNSDKMIIKSTDEEQISYVLSKKKRVKFRILFIYLKDFNKQDFDNMKKRANKYINKKHEISQYSNFYAPRSIRINIIIVDKPNEYLENIVHRNADRLFSRFEPILNVVVYKELGMIKVPAHFGMSCIYDYNLVWKIIVKTATEKTRGRHGRDKG